MLKMMKSGGPGLLLRLALLHNSDGDAAAARALKRALLIESAGFNSRKPHVGATLGAPRVEEAFRYNVRLTHQRGERLLLSRRLVACTIATSVEPDDEMSA
jgi:hypothetical protein